MHGKARDNIIQKDGITLLNSKARDNIIQKDLLNNNNLNNTKSNFNKTESMISRNCSYNNMNTTSNGKIFERYHIT